ncbi:MAG: metallophosphoesterase [Planctomycetes bacterium]|nr:metallophosphoesterase [Planctomycetota bacterium]
MESSRRRFLFALAGLALAGANCSRNQLPQYEPPPVHQPLPPLADELRLVVFGDWGSGQIEQWQVAQGCDNAAAELGGFHAGLLLGDNFYPAGVDSVSDPLWRHYFAQVYDTPWLGLLCWHAILGNHDYAGDELAQVEYTRHSAGRWSMPAYYWRQDFAPAGRAPLLTVLGLDTNPECPRRKQQTAWLKAQLDELREAAWPVIALGHHPLLTAGGLDMKKDVGEELEPLLKNPVLDAFFAGHEHNAQLLVANGFTQVVLGGGGKRLTGLNEKAPHLLFSAVDYGFGVLRVRRGAMSLEVRDRTGKVLHVHKF